MIADSEERPMWQRAMPGGHWPPTILRLPPMRRGFSGVVAGAQNKEVNIDEKHGHVQYDSGASDDGAVVGDGESKDDSGPFSHALRSLVKR